MLTCGLLVTIHAGSAFASTTPNWTTGVKAVLPGDAAANPNPGLNSVSCPSPGNCSVVGLYRDSSSHFQGLLLSQSSGAWSARMKAPLPGDAGTDPSASVVSVSCLSAGNCVAVGYYQDSLGHSQGLLLTESSGAWSAMKAPLPGDAAPNPGVFLNSVSCPSAGSCTAVGSYENSAGEQGLLLGETSGSWTAAKMTPPGDAAANPQVNLGSVACPSVGNCVAIGSYRDTSTFNQVLLVNESSGTWSPAMQPPFPPDVGSGGGHGLGSVSCASAGNCAVTGYYYDSSGNTQGLLLSESSGAWSPGTRASLPSDAGPAPDVELYALSCASAGSCTAINSYEDSSSHYQGLLVSATPANPALALSAPATGMVGQALAAPSLEAVLSAGASPIGTISYTVFGPQASAPGSCASGGKPLGSASVSGNGTYHPAAGFTPTSPGRYWWYASYSGDTGDNPASSPCGASMAHTVVGSPPQITHLSQSHRRWREGKLLPHISKRLPVGTTFRFSVNERVRVRFAFTRLVKGRRVGRRCVARRTKGPRCARAVKAGALVFSGHAGRNKFRFQGRISARRRLKPGRYTLTVTATDSTGQKSAPRSLRFTII